MNRPDKLPLGPRQREVLALVGDGFTSNEIAERMHISVKTVETHRAHIRKKLGVTRASSLTKIALSWGLTDATANKDEGARQWVRTDPPKDETRDRRTLENLVCYMREAGYSELAFSHIHTILKQDGWDAGDCEGAPVERDLTLRRIAQDALDQHAKTSKGPWTACPHVTGETDCTCGFYGDIWAKGGDVVVALLGKCHADGVYDEGCGCHMVPSVKEEVERQANGQYIAAAHEREPILANAVLRQRRVFEASVARSIARLDSVSTKAKPV